MALSKDPIEARVEALLMRMTLDEKVGQMTQVVPWTTPDLEPAIRAGDVGSLLGVTDVRQINAIKEKER